MTARQSAIRTAARIWRSGLDRMDAMPVRAAAQSCYVPGGPSLTVLEDQIREDRRHRAVPDQQTAAAA